jgi:hypothetical protein
VVDGRIVHTIVRWIVERSAGVAGMRKLDPQLSVLVQRAKRARDLRSARPAATATRRAETVRVTVEFRGAVGDLEVVGFVRHSLIAHPRGATSSRPERSRRTRSRRSRRSITWS